MAKVNIKLASTGGVSEHNALQNIQGGNPDERYHLTQAQHTKVLSFIFENNVTSFYIIPTSGEKGVSSNLNLYYNIQSNDDEFVNASINNGIGNALVDNGLTTVNAGSSLVTKSFLLSLSYNREGNLINETKTTTYNAYAPQFAGVASVDDMTTYNEMIFYLIKYVQSSFAISKKSSPTAEYIWFVSNKPNAIIKDQNNFVQNQGVWNNGSTEFYRKEINILLADGVTSQTVYLYRSRGVKTLTDFTYKIE